MTLALSMVFVLTMATATNDNDANDPMPFVSIAAATANALRFLGLHEEADVSSPDDRDRTAHGSDNHASYEQRVRRQLK